MHKLLKMYFMTHSYSPISNVVWSLITAHNLTSEKRDNTYSPHPLTFPASSDPHFVPPQQHSTYNWHLSLLWVSVMHTLTRSSITVSRLVSRSIVSVYF